MPLDRHPAGSRDAVALARRRDAWAESPAGPAAVAGVVEARLAR